MAKKKTKMSAEHKAALAEGRRQGTVVRRYLEALENRSSGRQEDPAKLEGRLAQVQADIANEPSPVKRLELIQRRLDLEDRLASAGPNVDLDAVEAEFVEVAADYGDRKGISYPAWRELGVPAGVLKQAGVARTRRTA